MPSLTFVNMNLVCANINNLTSLWKTVGESANAYHIGPDFDYCAVSDSEWPNRLWFHTDVNPASLAAAKSQLRAIPIQVGISCFDTHSGHSADLFNAHDFEKQSEQTGMVRSLVEPVKSRTDLQFQEVSNEQEAILWEGVFQWSFGYRISCRLLLPRYPSTRFLIAYRRPLEPVGTAVLHHANARVMGIHSLGVLPEMRRQGLARQMMRHLLQQSRTEGFDYVTLQASSMGLDLYRTLGFQEQFVMRNYALNH